MLRRVRQKLLNPISNKIDEQGRLLDSLKTYIDEKLGEQNKIVTRLANEQSQLLDSLMADTGENLEGNADPISPDVLLSQKFVDTSAVATPGYYTNFMGVKISPKAFPYISEFVGTINKNLPVPCDGIFFKQSNIVPFFMQLRVQIYVVL